MSLFRVILASFVLDRIKEMMSVEELSIDLFSNADVFRIRV
jgi:hypothetical protein